MTYIAGAAGYALFAATLLLAASVAWTGQRIAPGRTLLVLAACFVVFLGLHPFPQPGGVICKPAILDPRATAEPYLRLWRNDAPLRVWLADTGAKAAVMNFVFYAGVGMLAARALHRWYAALALGAGLSGFVETAQLTGLFGVYRCAYRYFDTGDLLLNVGGVLAGFAVMRAWRARGRPA